MPEIRACKYCKKPIKFGRSDKLFCSVKCKSVYHYRLTNATQQIAYKTDAILHRNRSILAEVMGKHSKQKTIDMAILDKKKFNWNYFTGEYENAQLKRYHIVYDFAWMKFSNGQVLILRRYHKG